MNYNININKVEKNDEIETNNSLNKLIDNKIEYSDSEELLESDTNVKEIIIKKKRGRKLKKNIQEELDINKEIIVVKNRKGRKSKKNIQEELNKNLLIKPEKIIPNEKIFDLVEINNIEYFYDIEFNILLDENVVPVGFKKEKNFILYSESIINKEKILDDNDKIKKIMEKIKNI